ncbi:parafibromin-like [Oppia nitens]|uniref:parafibromin-like n=1 Tax=Oppia nitens TaxID=1686743 RepID=UPI0023DC1E09|nr:parafibromin-like [Oppia nitens]
MADPLSLLRQYNVNKKEIIEKNNLICFGEYCWPKTVKTNYLKYTSESSREGPKEYYTLECLLYFLKNIQLQHPTYVKQAASEKIPVVQRPDRKDLLSYLCGETATTASIDKSAPIELPISASQLKSELISAASASATLSGHGLSGNDSEATPNKLARMDEMEKVRKQFAARLDAPKFKKPLPSSILPGAPGEKSLRDAMSNDQIAALKAKRLAKKRSTIIDADTDLEVNQNSLSGTMSAPNVHSVLLQYDSNFTREIQTKERIWRNRTNILQSTVKNFQKSIFPTLQSIKLREDGHSSHKKPNTQISAGHNANSSIPKITPSATSAQQQQQQQQSASSQQQYNRYDQERFAKNDTVGFRIDTTGTYHGLTLKSVTEGSAQPKTATPDIKPNIHQSQHHSHSNSSSQPKLQKRTSRTPIIIIPATTTSLISMYNAKSILQELKFVDHKTGEQRRENEILIQRRKTDGTSVPYRIIDNPLKLSSDDWDRVVAVFVQGPAWQFKGWPWDGNPVEIFARIKAFHLKFDEMKLDTNVAKWSVEIIELSRNKRHLDRANLLKFWSLLDGHIIKHKHNILRY